MVWQMNAVTLSAQILTLPVCIYHFHQFPNFFLLTNMIAVPLSGIILLGEITLCVIAWVPGLSFLISRLLVIMIRLMNGWIEKIESLPLSVWDGLQITLAQAIFLLVFIAGISSWLMENLKKGMLLGLLGLSGFFILRSLSFFEASCQEKIVVYNIPHQKAIDMIDGRYYFFLGDAELRKNAFVNNFHFKPARTLYRITERDMGFMPGKNIRLYLVRNKTILFLDRPVRVISGSLPVDLLIISGNPMIRLSHLADILKIRKIIFDGSSPSWKLRYWKKDCDSLGIPYHDVSSKGAFVMNLR
jgi:competence protein ComEC